MTTVDDFDREMYLSLADEFDPMGATEEIAFDETDWDPEYVSGARRFAAQMAIPLPWDVRSMDDAVRYVEQAERYGRIERCESGWTGDRCSRPLGHDGLHSNE